ncbi:oxidoreductase, 2OG-Fe(II) oxygenase family [Trichophyton verrucosum HKI 0517]|uniref:Oxidoreductase, 2OG-Fe(II) oxygenase family n=1 Tax=Trichophyton verrucosum (strain HKI 0517) TaxID=663202 RepID=D4D1Z0_TRIVH|nr:oxidoreductase, 2OG-Fe(II) oxygenase family [Trichophyton verrucosum HKI 0517]EFE44132.1 oxidoreductase, 2OG-Fe(II) oxygenase family [Trichophyton verrucosum HKI 0517]
MSQIPVIDFAPFRDGSPEDAEATGKKIFEAFRDVGFVYLKNHGVPQEVVDEAFSWSKKLFDLPQSEKEKAPHPPEGWWHRGYSGIGREKVTQMVFDSDTLGELRKIPDVKESFEMGREDDETTPNIWLPESTIPGFRAFFNNFFEINHDVGQEILRAVAIGMGLDRDFFESYHTMKDNQTRLLHYPPVEEEMLRQGEKERIAAHTDFATMTLLFQDDVGGLEVEDIHQTGVFNPVPYIPGTMVVNIADFLMRWSNDTLRSTMHRVRAPPVVNVDENGQEKDGDSGGQRMSRARYSIPYFIVADKNKVIDCLPGCYGPDQPKKYEPIASGDYIAMRLNAIS